jgi:Fe-S oxidoreductase/nitrate reductase gamma subunit
MLSSFDMLIVIGAFTVLVWGMWSRYKIWKRGNPKNHAVNRRGARLFKVMWYIFRHQEILQDLSGGTSHLFVFWGFLVPVIVVIAAQLKPIIPLQIARGVSLLLDLVGLLAMLGTVMFLYRNLRDKQGKQKKSLIHLWILLAILASGFLAEGARLKIVDVTGFYQCLSSPIGYSLSYVMPRSPLLLNLLIRSHFFLVLFFIAALPFTVMRHAVAAVMNVYYQKLGLRGVIEPMVLEGDYFGTGKIADMNWKQLLDADACISCGRCEKNCPAFISGQPLSPRGVIQEFRRKMEASYRLPLANAYEETRLLKEDGVMGGEDIWCCTACLACVESCPVFVEHLDKIVDMRRHAVLSEAKFFPQEYKQTFKHAEIFGDTLGKGGLLREDWAMNLKIKRIYHDPQVELLFWVGCMGALYDETSRYRTATAASILQKAGVDFGILGKEERCCGDPIRRMGNEYLFQDLARENIETLRRYNVKKIVTFCPHGFHVFRNEYPQFGADFEVMHFTQLIKAFLDEGRLNVKSKIDGLFTYHDPCYMGRYNGLCQTPRDLLGSLVESYLTEMMFSRKSSFCCGAGGGNFWRGKVVGRRMEELRIEQAIERKANGVITACPFCEIMFDSAVTQKGLGHSFKVMDILELVDQVT